MTTITIPASGVSAGALAARTPATRTLPARRVAPTANPARRGSTMCAIAVLSLCMSVPTHAQQTADDGGGSLLGELLGVRKKEEGAYRLPDAPRDEDLQPFYVSPTATLRFALDRRSLSYGDDGIYRMTIVITSDQGARNVTYEGIRCDTYQTRLYATLSRDGRWQETRSDWRRIFDATANRYQSALFRDWLCEGVTAAGKPAAILERMQREGIARQRSY